MTETREIHREIHGNDPTDLAAAIREAAPNVGRIEVGEGEERIIIAEASPAKWRRCGGCTLCCTVAGINELSSRQ
jgi:hypothetical protein